MGNHKVAVRILALFDCNKRVPGIYSPELVFGCAESHQEGIACLRSERSRGIRIAIPHVAGGPVEFEPSFVGFGRDFGGLSGELVVGAEIGHDCECAAEIGVADTVGSG